MCARTLAIGDIHGCDVALSALLSSVSVSNEDTVVVLGDVVDRGPGTRNAIEQLLDLKTRCRLIVLLGNHEEMLLNALDGGEWGTNWLRYGGHATLDSYEGDPARIPARHLEFLDSGLDYLERDHEIFIHANLEPGVPLEDQTAEWLRWTHLTGLEQPHPSGKRIICGHTPQRSGLPLVLPGWVCIDTLAFGPGWLTCLDVQSNEFFQANQAGDLRSGLLD